MPRGWWSVLMRLWGLSRCALGAGVAKWISGVAAAPVVVATWPLCCSWAVALVVGAYCPGGGYDVAPMW